MAGIVAAPTLADRPLGPLTLRPRVLRTLLWLRWQLLLRGYSRSASRIVGTVLMVVVLLPLAGGLAIGLVAGFHALLPDQAFVAQNILFFVLAGLYLVYALLPLLQYNLNEGLDITKLTLYPLSRLELMAGLLIATLLDIPTFGVAIVCIGIGVGWAATPLQGLAMAGILLLAYVHLVGISQLLLSAFMGLLRTRRFRDLSLVLVTLLGLSCSLGSQVITRVAPVDGTATGVIALVHIDVGQFLQFVPPGMAARGIVAAYDNDWAFVGLWALLLAITAGLVLWAWSAVLNRSLTTPEVVGGGAVRRRGARRALPAPVAQTAIIGAAPVAAAPRFQLIPAPSAAIARKDLIYYWRDPQYKRAFLSTLYIVGIILLNFFTLGGTGRTTSQAVVGVAIFQVLNLTAFAFGYEGAALGTLSYFPVRAVHIFLGKNLAAFTVGVAELLLLLILQGALSGNWAGALVLGSAGLAGLIAAMGPANAIAVLVPLRVAKPGVGRSQGDSGTGCVSTLLIFVSYLVVGVLIIPILAAVLVPAITGHTELYAFLLPLSLVYGVGIYAGGTALASSLYYDRLPKIMEVVARE